MTKQNPTDMAGNPPRRGGIMEVARGVLPLLTIVGGLVAAYTFVWGDLMAAVFGGGK